MCNCFFTLFKIVISNKVCGRLHRKDSLKGLFVQTRDSLTYSLTFPLHIFYTFEFECGIYAILNNINQIVNSNDLRLFSFKLIKATVTVTRHCYYTLKLWIIIQIIIIINYYVVSIKHQ